MAAIEVRSMTYAKHPFPELAACVAALPLCEMTGADEIHLVNEGEVMGQWFRVDDVKQALGLNPWMSCFFGLGNVDDEHGWNYVPGRHLLGVRR